MARKTRPGLFVSLNRRRDGGVPEQLLDELGMHALREHDIRNFTREDLLAADVIVTNFHSLGDGREPDDLLAKLEPEDVDMIVVDEAHIAAAESYQRTFAHFSDARKLLMSACFQSVFGKGEG